MKVRITEPAVRNTAVAAVWLAALAIPFCFAFAGEVSHDFCARATSESRRWCLLENSQHAGAAQFDDRTCPDIALETGQADGCVPWADCDLSSPVFPAGGHAGDPQLSRSPPASFLA